MRVPLLCIVQHVLFLHHICTRHARCACNRIARVCSALKLHVDLHFLPLLSLKTLTILPGFNLSVNSLRVTTPLSGKPFAIPWKDYQPPSIFPSPQFHTHLRNYQHVGSDAAIFGREIFPGPAESGLHFVEDQHNPMFVGNLT